MRHENDVTEFAFSRLGFTWDEGDAGPCLCSVTQSGELDTLRIVFSDEQGFGFLTWKFPEQTFDFIFMADPYELHGSTEADSASGVFRSFDFSVSEPGTLLTFSLGLGLLFFGRSFAAK